VLGSTRGLTNKRGENIAARESCHGKCSYRPEEQLTLISEDASGGTIRSHVHRLPKIFN
jgi:hypothetical protein